MTENGKSTHYRMTNLLDNYSKEIVFFERWA